MNFHLIAFRDTAQGATILLRQAAREGHSFAVEVRDGVTYLHVRGPFSHQPIVVTEGTSVRIEVSGGSEP